MVFIINTFFLTTTTISKNNNNLVFANSLTNNRVLYVDNTGKLATSEIEENKLKKIDEIEELKSKIIEIETQLSNQKGYLLDNIYPVGSIYISVNNTDPHELFGGTWVSIGSGRTLVGVDTSDSDFNTVEKIGGNKTHYHTTASHTLTVSEIPSHSHTIGHTHTRGSMNITGEFSANVGWFGASASGAFVHNGTDNVNSFSNASYNYVKSRYGFNAANSWSGSTSGPSNNNSGNTGGSGGHSHGNTGSSSSIQPYVTVYIWKRTK